MDGSQPMIVSEVAEWLRADAETILKYARTGELPGTRVGKEWIFLRDQVLAFLKARIETETAQRRKKQAHVLDGMSAVLVNPKPLTRRKVLPALPSLPGMNDHHK